MQIRLARCFLNYPQNISFLLASINQFSVQLRIYCNNFPNLPLTYHKSQLQHAIIFCNSVVTKNSANRSPSSLSAMRFETRRLMGECIQVDISTAIMQNNVHGWLCRALLLIFTCGLKVIRDTSRNVSRLLPFKYFNTL